MFLSQAWPFLSLYISLFPVQAGFNYVRGFSSHAVVARFKNWVNWTGMCIAIYLGNNVYIKEAKERKFEHKDQATLQYAKLNYLLSVLFIVIYIILPLTQRHSKIKVMLRTILISCGSILVSKPHRQIERVVAWTVVNSNTFMANFTLD